MAIEVKCTHCGKTYRVDPKMTGKKAKCKGCGNTFTIQLMEQEEMGGDLLAGLSSAASAEQSAGPSAPLAGAGYGVTPMPMPAAVFCPACGSAMAETAVICVSCGFNKQLGMHARTQVVHAAPQSGRLQPANRERRGYGGMRANDCYTNPFLHFLDQWIPMLCIWGFWLAVAGLYGLMILGGIMGGAHGGAVFGVLLVLTVMVLLDYFVFFNILVKGIELAGKIMKFELPEEPVNRIIAMWVVSFVFSCPISGILMTAGGAVGSASGNEGVAAGVVLMTFVVTMGISLAIQFLLFWFFFRLKFLEAIVGYLFYVIFSIVATIALAVVAWLLLMVMGLIFGAAMTLAN